MSTYLRRIIGVILLALVGIPLQGDAHNGRVAIAVPVEGITIDGNLVDWPADMRNYPIVVAGGGEKPESTADFQGRFRIGYRAGENALYLAVEIADESTVIDAGAGSRQDGCEVYVDELHGDKNSPGMVYAVYGEERQVRGFRGELLPWEGVEVGVRREEGRNLYEWKIILQRQEEKPVELRPNTTLGLDLRIFDRDEDGSHSRVLWGEGTRKRQLAERRGDLVLVGEGRGTGMLQGRVGSAEGVEGEIRRVQSLDSAALWVVPEVDEEGDFSVELPVGQYEVEARYWREEQGKTDYAIPVEIEERGFKKIALVPRWHGRSMEGVEGTRSMPERAAARTAARCT